jgi:anti-anti-sigma factor
MSDDQLRVKTALTGDTCTMELAGGLDLATAENFRDAVMEACGEGARVVILDLSDLEFMDSTGLHTILQLRDRVALSVVRASRGVRRMFEITGVPMEHEGGGPQNGGSSPP